VRFKVNISFSNSALSPNSVYSNRCSSINRADEIARWRLGIALALVSIAATFGVPFLQDWSSPKKKPPHDSERVAVSPKPQADSNQKQSATEAVDIDVCLKKPSNLSNQPRRVWQRPVVAASRRHGSTSQRNTASLANQATPQAYGSSVAEATLPGFYSGKSGIQVQFEDRTRFPDGVEQFHRPRK
jgi:hypothetical protein